ncbi:MAG: YegS/Rv2252/BmrU family lipid kinase, partial [Clostridiales Family XIII bacterium]|nr:YegS/Rv2252/BmrU family lipid kinase [Clostridiales Family XIII bacterium]
MKKPCKVLLFYNPLAGNGLFKSNLDMIVDRFQRRNMVVVPVRASRQRQLDVIFQNMDVSEYRKLIAAGGDGTINVMVNAMLRNGIDLPLAIFPSGTANDFAYYMDLPTRMDEMIDIALEERYTLADVGKANSSYFINVLAMGMMVDVSQKIDPGIKNTLGVISYYIRGFSELPNLRPIAVRISGDGFCIEENIFFMLAMNGRSAGGFKRIAPDAEINDGLLDVLVFKAMPIVEMAPLLVNVMTGQHKGNKNVIFFRTSRMRVESEQAINTDVDGEKGGALPLEVSLLPRRIRVNTL